MVMWYNMFISFSGTWYRHIYHFC